jgi:ABC-type sugar transport system ATPase subunit
MAMTDPTVPVLEARRLVKTFGGVNALQGADFIVDAGTVTALIGDNGAGKSTLVKVLSGVHPPDGGEILLDGTPVSFHSPLDAHRKGIETVYQDLALAPHGAGRPAPGRRRPSARRPEALRHRLSGRRAGGRRGERR